MVLYDYSPDKCDLKGWFQYMEKWADDIGIPWESIGISTSNKLIQFKNGKRKIEKNNFDGITEIELLGGVLEPGTHLSWRTYAFFPKKSRGKSYVCFPDSQKLFTKQVMIYYLVNLLSFGDFKYGICYQRPYNMGPALYAGGALGGIDLPREEETKIGSWNRKYNLNPHYYRTGLLRDVYPFNVLIETHLKEKIGHQTLEDWIKSTPSHGSLDKLTSSHWLWSIDNECIPAAQETLQEAGLLLCYKP